MAYKKAGGSTVRPRILLVGLGRFGEHHFRILTEFHKKGLVEFSGVVIRNKKKREKIELESGIKTYEKVTPSLLKSVDAVDIVTPPETHFEIVKKCLPYTNVFVEKPLATNAIHAQKLMLLSVKHKRILTVGHILRFHPVSEKLYKLIGGKEMPRKIEGVFINPKNLDQEREPSLEFMHMFDIVDMLWAKTPEVVYSSADGNISIVDVRYRKNHDARFVLGCRGDKKERVLHFRYPDYTISADFVLNTITYRKGGFLKVYQCPPKQELLEKELSLFISTLLGGKNTVDATIATQIVSIGEKAIPEKKAFPSVAIIGGGIFGTSIATELGKFCSVTIFEKNPDIMQEGAFVNCFRHHKGYHYPRSSATVIDIQNSQADFEEIYQDAIVPTGETYYALAKNKSLVTQKEFLAFCKKHKLPYKKGAPPANILATKETALCVCVPESNYHFPKLKKITEDRLSSMEHVKILYNTTVTNCSLTELGEKVVTYQRNKFPEKTKKFDFVINATYANINNMTTWLSFEKCPIRIDLAEVVVLKLPIPPISITIIDGPFASLLPTGNQNEFTLYHVTESIIDRYTPLNGLVKKTQKNRSNKTAILRESMKFFPILKDATITESRIVHRGVQAYHEHDDSRVVDLIDHGFGCFSVLSGKILSSITTGKKVADLIKKYSS